MAGFKIPIFEKGSVLTQEMLEALKGYAVDLGNLSYTGYSDGILSGCQVTMSGNMLYIHKGMLIYGQRLYFLSKEMNIVVNPGKQWQVLRIRIGNMNKAKNFLIGDMQLELASDVQENKDKIEICRFRLQDGALLRNKYRDFQDLTTEFDTINEIYAQWSGYENPTISNRVLKEFATEAMKKGVKDSADIAFVTQILSLDSKSMNREAIQFYIASRLQRTYTEMSNLDIYRGLQEVLRNVGKQGIEHRPVSAGMERRIIVD